MKEFEKKILFQSGWDSGNDSINVNTSAAAGCRNERVM